jgi:hypothetical protein
MDAARIKAARRRLWRAWVFGGLIWSVAFTGVAAALVWLLGAPGAQAVQLGLTLALVGCVGFYAIIHLGAVCVAVIQWIARRRPE